MEIQAYKAQALKTAADLGSVINDLTHAALGLCDESHELAMAQPGSTNEIEELGDCLWFATLAGELIEQATGVDVWEQRPTERTASPRMAIMINSCAVAGMAKKPFAYGMAKKPIPWQELAECVGVIISAIEDTATSRNLSLADVMRANLAKLGVRYDGAFCATQAVERDTSAEIAGIDRELASADIAEYVAGALSYEICDTIDERDAAISRIVSNSQKAESKFFSAAKSKCSRCWVIKALPLGETHE